MTFRLYKIVTRARAERRSSPRLDALGFPQLDRRGERMLVELFSD